MRKLRLGIFILSNSWGGAEESVYNIAKNIDKNGFTVHLLVNEFLWDRYKAIDSINVINLGRLESNKKVQKVYTILKIRSRVFASVKKYHLEVIHARLENSLIVLGAGIRKLDIPAIFTLSGDETKIYNHPETLEHHIIRMILARMLTDENTVVTSISTWLAKNFDEKESSRITVIPNSVNCNKFKPLKMTRRNNTVLYVGRYVKGKGIEDLIKVAGRLKGYKFMFAGTGPLKNLICLPNTKDLGFVDRETLAVLYNRAAVCVFPSHREAFGLACLEAMACGATIVATAVGFSDYVENGVNGVLIGPGNFGQLKKAIVKLMKNPSWRRSLGKNARKKALKYDVKRLIRIYQDLYHQVVAK